MERRNKPSALSSTPGMAPQAQVTISENARVKAELPTGESIDILLHGATILSWKDSSGDEKLWLSEAAKLDGSGAARGGIPIVFPVFGTAPDHPAVAKLPQHGFARNSRWEFLSKSTTEGSGAGVKLDFALSSDGLDANTRALWPYSFGLIYSVTLEPKSLTTSLIITNDDDKPFEFQTLLHTYFRVKNIESIEVSGLEDSEYIDKVDSLKVKSQSGAIKFTGETDRVYTPPKGSEQPLVISEAGKPLFNISRKNLDEAVVFNPWIDKANSIGDFQPKDGWKNMVCVEPGSVKGFQTLDPSDAYEAAQTITLA